ncbi:bifunctional MFS transporter/dTMP kinase [Amycolatopsis suaedae]|uniref:Thymidylate kinase n=1 Tax=Amycolatopsis suaedae TaxID=2510978 RepID=A0A4Q7J3Q4_9PSEU|nr:MFS transporter [Amycolatopsis suaedae]RZQ61619.1 MFS transporter [Amycolatopsis suaedae]
MVAERRAETEGATAQPAPRHESTVHRARRVLAIRPFRRLWFVTYMCSSADWMSLMALSALVSNMTQDYTAQSFAFGSVVITNLLPGLLFAPLGGLLADRFDRRKIMVVCDLLRFGLLMSIVFIDAPWWLYVGNFFVGVSAMAWIPSKDAAVPNLLRRRDQVETANQLGMVMTYGLAVITGAGFYAIVTGVRTTFHLPDEFIGLNGPIKIAVVVAALLYLASALTIATRIPELSLRNVHESPLKQEPKDDGEPSGFLTMIKDAARFVRTTPLVRGLFIGLVGALAAGGAVIGSAQVYAYSLNAGQSAFGMLFAAVFVGLTIGMAGAPKLARRLPHDRLFGVAIVFAGFSLILVALSPHLAVSLITVMLVGACAGAAFLTGVTIIGSQVDDAIRGRINAIYQSLMKVVLGLSVAVVPLLIALVRPTKVDVWGGLITIDGTRPVMLGGGLLAALVGVLAYRQMDSRRTEPILADLRNALRRRPRRVNGLLITIEGTTAADTSGQAAQLAEWLDHGPRNVVLAADPALDQERLTTLLTTAELTGARAQALAAAAVRADLVERDVQPALDGGSIVVMERYVDSPLAHLSAVAGLDPEEFEGLADWATGQLRPDITVLLDKAPEGNGIGRSESSDQWGVKHLLSEMAAADPDRYVVVDADGTEEQVRERVRDAVRAVLIGPFAGVAPTEATS